MGPEALGGTGSVMGSLREGSTNGDAGERLVDVYAAVLLAVRVEADGVVLAEE